MAIHNPPSIDDFEDLRRLAKESVDTAVDYLIRIDNLLMRMGELLYVMQPFQSGRIAIDFNLHRGQAKPFIRVYRKLRAGKGKWTSTNVSHQGLTKRVKRSREFEPNHKLMLVLCERITKLFELRGQMHDRLRYLMHGVSLAVSKRGTELDELEALVNGMLDRVEMQFEGKMEVE
ncbi:MULTISPECIES: hypothetical protein [unclassified Pseudomonas]|uniref:hypothetical protein n=1 Tax=unclassified Pseudomonas TaxID=196821 RepID=UPI000C86A95C|nr:MULTISPECIES: hypothetical protein [unclassified Pseudomonas]PMV91216.1 hypothetical protein C1X55_31410 [Pseudomonas sp. GW460-C8]PMW23309.1 hypothetical protein C1X53_12160 [Pseudomonas sp. GW456-E6]PMW24215.1 hypothetical protein C1X40_05225 [Pseudomonas sp. GW456-11-11-14-TSB2]PMW40109.1 hypothetical protein C1X45_08535 [Pseudomonas sp. GW460-7]PMW41220.1 hypothetical protein C1X48_07170 [Pseudomonas sp. FW305-3-2-15-A-R2A1]